MSTHIPSEMANAVTTVETERKAVERGLGLGAREDVAGRYVEACSKFAVFLELGFNLL